MKVEPSPLAAKEPLLPMVTLAVAAAAALAPPSAGGVATGAVPIVIAPAVKLLLWSKPPTVASPLFTLKLVTATLAPLFPLEPIASLACSPSIVIVPLLPVAKVKLAAAPEHSKVNVPLDTVRSKPALLVTSPLPEIVTLLDTLSPAASLSQPAIHVNGIA